MTVLTESAKVRVNPSGLLRNPPSPLQKNLPRTLAERHFVRRNRANSGGLNRTQLTWRNKKTSACVRILPPESAQFFWKSGGLRLTFLNFLIVIRNEFTCVRQNIPPGKSRRLRRTRSELIWGKFQKSPPESTGLSKNSGRLRRTQAD